MEPYIHITDIRDTVINIIAGWEMSANETRVELRSQIWYNIATIAEEYYHEIPRKWKFHTGTVLWECLWKYLYFYYYPDQTMAQFVAENYLRSALNVTPDYRIRSYIPKVEVPT